MNELKENLIERLDELPEAALQEVMDFVAFLSWRGFCEDAPLLDLAGQLSCEPISNVAIEAELYGAT